MAVFPASNLQLNLWAEGVNRYIRINTKTGRLTGSESILLLNRIQNCWALYQLVKTWLYGYVRCLILPF